MHRNSLKRCTHSLIMSGKSFYGSTEVVLGVNSLKNLDVLRNLMQSPGVKLMVVADFDHTLTKFTSLQCHDVVGYHKDYDPSFIEDFQAVFKMPFASLSEWWRVCHDLIVEKSGLTQNMLQDRMDECLVHARDGCGDLITDLRQNEVPLIIVSAGIRDVIHHTLLNCNVPTEDDHLFHVDANYMEFLECGKLGEILPLLPVHSQSKHEVAQRAPHLFHHLHETNASTFESDLTTDTDTKTASPTPPIVAIVLGDRAWDFEVLSAFPNTFLFRIGFARDFEAEHVDPLLVTAQCDVVLVGQEHSLEPVHSLMKELLALRNGSTAK